MSIDRPDFWLEAAKIAIDLESRYDGIDAAIVLVHALAAHEKAFQRTFQDPDRFVDLVAAALRLSLADARTMADPAREAAQRCK